MIKIGRVTEWVQFYGFEGKSQNFPCELLFSALAPFVVTLSYKESVVTFVVPAGVERLSFTSMAGLTLSVESDEKVYVYNDQPGLLSSRDLPSLVDFESHRMSRALSDAEIEQRRSRLNFREAGKRADLLQQTIEGLQQQIASMSVSLSEFSRAKPEVPEAKE